MGRQQAEGPRGSQPRPGRRSPWTAALLAASVLTSCYVLTEGTVTLIRFRLQPEHPTEGQEVTLFPERPLENAVVCRWFRGLGINEQKRILTYILPLNSQENGPAFTHRETGGPDCTLRIRNLTSEDTENYTILMVDIAMKKRVGFAFLVVSGSDHSHSSNSLASGAIAGIIIGSLTVAALIVGTLFYFFRRARGQSVTVSVQTTTAASTYENVSPFGQVKTGNSDDSSHIYQNLQHADQSVYQQLKGNQQVSQPLPLS